MRFNVPQFVDIEDTIIGPLTLKQFFLVIGGGVVIAILWYMFKLWFVFLLGVPLALVILAIVFVKIGGRPITQIFTSWLNYWIKPRFYTWKKSNK
jgi:hypothetical protein